MTGVREVSLRQRLLMKTTNASNARKHFARLLESVIDNDEPVIIVRYREPIAAIVPMSRLHPAERAMLKNRREADSSTGRRHR
jgi:antitoxin (DNA-binding transcriptional repressor) of toxin-antitoxin stability system